IVRAARASRNVDVLAAPHVVTNDGEAAEIQTGDTIAFLASYDVREENGVKIADPVVGEVAEGMLVRLRPVVGTSGTITLELEVSITEVVKPIPRRRVHLEGVDETLEVEVPEILTRHHIRSTVRMEDGEQVLLSFRDETDPDASALLVAVGAQVLRDALPDDPWGLEAPVPPVPAPVVPSPDTRLVNVEVRLLESPPQLVAAVFPDGAPDTERPATLLSADDAARLLQGGDGLPASQVVSAPRLTTYDGQRANISMLEQVSYVQDYDVEVGEGGEFTASPVIGTVQDGLVLELVPHLRDDGAVDLEIALTLAELIRPIPEFETTLGGRTLTIQLPELRVQKVDHEALIPDAGWLVLGGFGDGEAGVRLALVHVQIVVLEETEIREGASR
ncbi:MAG: hypothetical protein ACYTG6_09830, partial [Planctomycetota bacterium]